jgi:hypothetical protein
MIGEITEDRFLLSSAGFCRQDPAGPAYGAHRLRTNFSIRRRPSSIFCSLVAYEMRT